MGIQSEKKDYDVSETSSPSPFLLPKERWNNHIHSQGEGQLGRSQWGNCFFTWLTALLPLQSYIFIPTPLPPHYNPLPSQTSSPPDAYDTYAQSDSLLIRHRQQYCSGASDGSRSGTSNAEGLLIRVGTRGGLDHRSSRKSYRRWDLLGAVGDDGDT